MPEGWYTFNIKYIWYIIPTYIVKRRTQKMMGAFNPLVSMNQTKWWAIAACPSLMRSFNRSKIKMNKSSKFVLCVFFHCVGIGLVD